MLNPYKTIVAIALALVFTTHVAFAEGTPTKKLYVGTATTSITPDEPVALDGQMHLRISKKTEAPCIASVLVLESRQGDQTLDTAVMVSCDLVTMPNPIIEAARNEIKKRLPELDTKKVILNATHTHTAPVTRIGKYELPKEGVIQVEEYYEFFAKQIADAVEKAWKARKPGGVSWGLGHAVIAYNRRVVYADGSAVMYGEVKRDDFRQIEGPEDHGVELLFFWDEDKKLVATAINIACPAQNVESLYSVHSDFWHPTREMLKKKYGKDLCILAWCGAAGDQSPHLEKSSNPRQAADLRMMKLRGLTCLEELARRIVRAFDEVYEVADQEIHYNNVPLVHAVEDIKLPVRIVTEEEHDHAQAEANKLKCNKKLARRRDWYLEVIRRYGDQKKNPWYDTEIHVLRLGDVAIATNTFELFTDYGIQMKARSKALQTFVIQLTGIGTYVPTAKAAEGGGYSAIVQSNDVGPEGGQVLVERTVKEVNKLWDNKD